MELLTRIDPKLPTTLATEGAHIEADGGSRLQDSTAKNRLQRACRLTMRARRLEEANFRDLSHRVLEALAIRLAFPRSIAATASPQNGAMFGSHSTNSSMSVPEYLP